MFNRGEIMLVTHDKKDSRYFDNRKRRYKKIISLIAISVLIIATAITLFIMYQLNNIYYTDYTVAENIERSDSTYTRYTNYKDGILQYSKDGAMYIDGQGDSIWNSTYDMSFPTPDISDDYLIISDAGNKRLELFNGAGHVKSLEVLYPIIKAEVASQGVVAVLMDGGDVDYFQLLSPTGHSLMDYRTIVDKSGFPIDFSVSQDGTKLVTSYMSVNSGLIQSKITFYNFGGVGQNYEAKVVGGFDYGQTLVTKVEFINNDTVSVFGDDRFSIYDMEEIPSLVFEEDIQAEIKSITYNDEYVGIIQKNIDGESQYLLMVYNIKGEKILNEHINYNYDQFQITNDELILFSGTELNILRLNGKEKFNTSLDTSLISVFPVSTKDEYLIISQSNIKRIKLIK